eukprot:1175746-Amphidinium_carterae.1
MGGTCTHHSDQRITCRKADEARHVGVFPWNHIYVQHRLEQSVSQVVTLCWNATCPAGENGKLKI